LSEIRSKLFLIAQAVGRQGDFEALLAQYRRVFRGPIPRAQLVEREVRLTPFMPATLDAPAAAGALGGELHDEQAKPRVEIGDRSAIAGERGVGGEDVHSGRGGRREASRSDERPPDSARMADDAGDN